MGIFKNKKPIAIWLMSFLLLLCLIVTSTLAWFSINQQVQIQSPSDENLAVQINAGDLEVAVAYQQTSSAVYGQMSNYSEFGKEIELNVPTPQFIDVSGNGEILYFPRSLSDDDQPLEEASNWETVTDAMGYCMTIKVKFRTSQRMTIFLDDTSLISGLENVVGDSFVRSSALGNFSCDGICAAVRVAFLEVIPSSATDPERYELKNVWVPNDTYRLTYNEGGTAATFTTDGTREEQYCYWADVDGSMRQLEFGFEDIREGKLTIGDYGLSNSEFSLGNTATPLLEFEANGEMQEKELIVRIWFEGTDSESDKALDGGAIQYKFGFTGIRKDAASADTNSAVAGIRVNSQNNLVWSNGSDVESGKILYSFDCITWNAYSTGADITGHTAVYVRAVETVNTFIGDIYAIDY